MAVGNGVRGTSWVDGQFTVRLRGPGHEPGRIIRIRRPFALIGQIPGADIRIDDPSVDGRHALLLLDRRGVFGVDLLSRSGTRFAGAEATSAWLGAGDILEIAGRRIELLQLRIDGSTVDPPLSDDDLLGDSPGLVGLTLEPVDSPGPPWSLASALAFVGRGDACAIRVENASASWTHCALFRGTSSVHMINLLGRRTLVNDQAVEGTSELLDGDVLTVGQARFGVRFSWPITHEMGSVDALTRNSPIPGPFPAREPSTTIARINDPSSGQLVPLDPRGAMVALLREAVGSVLDASNPQLFDFLRQFQSDTATLLEAQIHRIEALNHEIASLREEVRHQMGPPAIPAEPLRLDLIPPPADPSSRPPSWLMDRLAVLETENRSTWKEVLARFSPTGPPKTPTRPVEPSPKPDRLGLPVGVPEISQDRF